MSALSETKLLAAYGNALRNEVIGGQQIPLYLQKSTLDCIINSCVVCSYRLLVRLPHQVRKLCAPNQRPEMCLRCKSPPVTASLYSPVANTLVIGDGDLSFSLALCKKLKACNNKNNFAKLNVVATTYLTKNELYKTYPATASNNVKKLIKCGVTPVHGVDATILGTSKCKLLLNGHAGERKYHRVIWNFPCVHSPMDAVDQNQRGRDGQNEEMEENKKMLRLFFSRVVDLLIPGGEVHLVHKTKPPYNQWDISEQVGDSGMQLAGAVVFDREMYPGYINRKALVGRGSFPISDARTFIFVAPMILRPNKDIASIGGTFLNSGKPGKTKKENELILVENDLLKGVCNNLMKRKKEGLLRAGSGSGKKKRRKK